MITAQLSTTRLRLHAALPMINAMALELRSQSMVVLGPMMPSLAFRDFCRQPFSRDLLNRSICRKKGDIYYNWRTPYTFGVMQSANNPNKRLIYWLFQMHRLSSQKTKTPTPTLFAFIAVGVARRRHDSRWWPCTVGVDCTFGIGSALWNPSFPVFFSTKWFSEECEER